MKAVPTIPIDDRARNGGYQLVLVRDEFAIARWAGDCWRDSGGTPLPHEPDAYWHKRTELSA